MLRDIATAFVKAFSGSAGALLAYMAAFKIVALLVGPAGTGLLSMLRQFQQTAVSLATLSGQVVLVQGVASRPIEDRPAYLRAVLVVFVTGFVLMAAVIVSISPVIASCIWTDADRAGRKFACWLIVPIGLQVLSSFCSGVLNASGAVGYCALVQLVGGLCFALSAYPVVLLGLNSYTSAAFIAMLAVSSAGGLALGLFFMHRKQLLLQVIADASPLWNAKFVCEFVSLAAAVTFTTVLGGLVLLGLRVWVGRTGSLADVGLLDAAWMISMGHVMLLLAALQTYYLPRLAGEPKQDDQYELIGNVFFLVGLLAPILVTLTIVFKPLMIELLYSEEYRPALRTLRWTLIGDYFKICGWVLAMPLLAFADSRVFLLSEVLWNVLFVAVIACLQAVCGPSDAIGVAFLAAYVSYAGFCWYRMQLRYKRVLRIEWVRSWLFGLGAIITTSVVCWNQRQIVWSYAVACVAASSLPLIVELVAMRRASLLPMTAALEGK